ncbi:MAG: hypothetical protein ACI85I_001482 [Arenicella sp.]|jgi:hypothetical protein
MVTNKDIGFVTMSYNSPKYLSIEEMNNDELIGRYSKFERLLELSKSSGLLIPEKFTILRSHFTPPLPDLELSKVELGDRLESICKDTLMSIPNTGIIGVSGCTELLKNNNDTERSRGCLSMYYSLRDGSLELSILCDAWLPLSLNGHLQLELAELNSPRLYSFVEKLYSDLEYDYSYPSQDEEDCESLYPQKGNRLYIYEDIRNRPDFPLSGKDNIRKYLWEYRNETI